MYKNLYKNIFLFFCFISAITNAQNNNLILKGVIDFDLISGGYSGKAIHLYANDEITDLDSYAIGVANNGNGGDGIEYIFPQKVVNAGDHILLLRDSLSMLTYLNSCFLNFDHIIEANNLIDQNGNDAIELYKDSIVIETFGDINVDATGTAWEYLDSWSFKISNSNNGTFVLSDWNFGNVECTIASITTQSSLCPYPFCEPSYFEDQNFQFNDLTFPNPAENFINLKNKSKEIFA